MYSFLSAVSFDKIWDFIGQWVAEHWLELVISLAAVLVGVWWGRRQARKRWKKREFLDRINISLNSIQDDALQIRTIMEADLQEVFHNSAAVEMVLAAARETTLGTPILPVAQEDCWFLLNAVLNEVSEKFAAGLIRRDVGLDVRVGRYVICLTCEADGQMRTRKVRAMLIQEDTLAKFMREYKEQSPRLESKWHETRVKTLRILAEYYHMTPHNFLTMEICVPR